MELKTPADAQPIEPRPYESFVRRLLFICATARCEPASLARSVLDGRFTENEMRRIVAYAKKWGFLSYGWPPRAFGCCRGGVRFQSKEDKAVVSCSTVYGFARKAEPLTNNSFIPSVRVWPVV